MITYSCLSWIEKILTCDMFILGLVQLWCELCWTHIQTFVVAKRPASSHVSFTCAISGRTPRKRMSACKTPAWQTTSSTQLLAPSFSKSSWSTAKRQSTCATRTPWFSDTLPTWRMSSPSPSTSSWSEMVDPQCTRSFHERSQSPDSIWTATRTVWCDGTVSLSTCTPNVSMLERRPVCPSTTSSWSFIRRRTCEPFWSSWIYHLMKLCCITSNILVSW